MPTFEHIRHKSPSELKEPRPLLVACAAMKSNVNVSTIIRTAGCCGVAEVVVTGNPKIDPKIARAGLDEVTITAKRSLPPVLKRLKKEGYVLVGLEQTTNSTCLHDYSFPKKCVIVIGSEREGLSQDALDQLDAVVEIPVWGMPHSYNVATATSMCLYEYCRQHPEG